MVDRCEITFRDGSTETVYLERLRARLRPGEDIDRGFGYHAQNSKIEPEGSEGRSGQRPQGASALPRASARSHIRT